MSKIGRKLKALAAIIVIAAFAVLALPITERASAQTMLEAPLDLLVGLEATQGADIAGEYKFASSSDAAYGSVLKFDQVKGDWRVIGGDVVVSLDKEGNILSSFGEHQDVSSLQRAKLGTDELGSIVPGNILDTQKVILGGEYAYEVKTDYLGGYKYIVSAVDGDILQSYSDASAVDLYNLVELQIPDVDGDEMTINVELNTKTGEYVLADMTKNIFTYDAHNTKPGTIRRDDMYKNNTGEFDAMAATIYKNVTAAYDFYADAANIGVSLKGANGKNDDIKNNYSQNKDELPIYILAHYSYLYQNAFCAYSSDSSYILICVGDGDPNSRMYQQGKALDVLAHEYQHAITALTAKLPNSNEPGALNEAISDIFGALVEGNDPSSELFWRIGEDGVNSNIIGELRDIRGGTLGQRYTMSSKFPDCNLNHNHAAAGCDDGGVHYNSTIPTHAQYLMYQKLPSFFTRQNIGKLWYTTLLTLTSTSGMQDFANKMWSAAKNLNYTEEQLEAVAYGLTEVGLTPENMTYTVTFKNYDDTVLYETEVQRGGTAIYTGTTPTREADAQYTYQFSGWDLPLTNITEKTTITAQYRSILRSYKVSFVDGQGNVLAKKTLDYGSALTFPDETEITAPGENYEFDGWFLDAQCTQPVTEETVVEGDMTVYGKWSEKSTDPAEPPENTGSSGGKKGGTCGTITFGSSGGPGIGIMIGLCAAAILAIGLAPRRKNKNRQ